MKISTIFRYATYRYSRQLKTSCLYLGGGAYAVLSWFWINHFRGSLLEHLPLVGAILFTLGAIIFKTLPKFMTELKNFKTDFKKFEKKEE